MCALVFSAIGTEAALENEATLTVTSGNSSTSESGTLQEMLNKLATASPSTATTYSLKLISDASYTTPIVLNGAKSANGLMTVEVDLNGFTVTSVANAPLFYVSGAVTKIEINGNFNSDGERGRILCDEESGAVVFVENNNYTKNNEVLIRNLEAVYTNLSKGYADGSGNGTSQAIVDVRSGYLKMENTVLTYNGTNAIVKYVSQRGDLPIVGGEGSGDIEDGSLSDMTVPLLNAEYATVTLKDCFINDRTVYSTERIPPARYP